MRGTRMFPLVFLFAFLSTNLKKALANEFGLMEDLNVAIATYNKDEVNDSAKSSLFAVAWPTVFSGFLLTALVMFGIRVMLSHARWICNKWSCIWSYPKQWAAIFLVYALSGKPDQLNLSTKDVREAKGKRRSKLAFSLNDSLTSCAPRPTMRTAWVLEQSLKPATLDGPHMDGSTTRSCGCFPDKQTDLRSQVKSCNFQDMMMHTAEPMQDISSARQIKPDFLDVSAIEDSALPRGDFGHGNDRRLDMKVKPARPTWNLQDLMSDKIDNPIPSNRGKKPDARLLRANDLMESGSANHKDLNFHLDFEDSDDEWSDVEHESIPRAAAPQSGEPMDGADVGTQPKTVLKLPRSQVKPTRLGSDGRSVLNVPWDVPPRRKRRPNGRPKLVSNGAQASQV